MVLHATHFVAWPFAPDASWETYASVMRAAQKERIRFALGGGTVAALYAGRRHQAKDLDLYILPADRGRMIDAVRTAGIVDYYEQRPYDRTWIFRGVRDGAIVDVMWQMANGRAEVDAAWLTNGPETKVMGLTLKLLPPEELIWSKIYVLQRERSDWPEVLNMLYVQGRRLDWNRLLERVGDDRPLLSSIVCLFAWICPGRAREFPGDLWPRLDLRRPEPGGDKRRLRLLDTRDWFGPNLPDDAPAA